MFWNSADDTSKAVLDVLETSYLVGREVEVKGVAVVQFGMDK
jgi:hypothetical protein